ncbi:MAG: hypothetical protein JNN28_15995, partial [Saprospiraceae bacterium]|nr:hypothetical protein [Saprospiraceae bacterium]
MNKLSLYAYWLSAAILLLSSTVYYPKWEYSGKDATISWDVSGYYLYLPATFIYKDIKTMNWWPEIERKYQPGPGMRQVFEHNSGNLVMKYPMGQALQFLPWFLTAHVLSEPLGYASDGFSRPYHVAISLGSLLIALIGLWLLRNILLRYFNERTTAIVLISITLGSNYLEYGGISGAMTHNWLFTLNGMLILASIRFYQKPGFMMAAAIGLLVGWATITRPTEILSALIPLLWGISSWKDLASRLQLFQQLWPKILVAGGIAFAIILLQPIYWKYATGEWIVYSYEEQGFTWFPPHIANVLWSAKAGWLVYSPIMILAVAGLFLLRKQLPQVFPVVAGYCLLALYVTSAWDIWWYGGSLGQRAIVQAYPLWAFCMGAFWVWAWKQSWSRWFFSTVTLVCIYLNVWWCHQAHHGRQFYAEQMTRKYILTVLGKWTHHTEDLIYLDVKDSFDGAKRQDVKLLAMQDFELDSAAVITESSPISGKKSARLTAEQAFTPAIRLPNPGLPYTWLRTTVTFRCEAKEWEIWGMTQFTVRFKLGERMIKEQTIRLQRHVEDNEVKTIGFDTRVPNEPFDQIEVFLWNPGSNK